MMDLLFQIGLSNALLALALALVALIVGAGARRPHLAHLLWLLVLIKLVTPPILTLPIGPFAAQPDNAVAISDNAELDADEEPAIGETGRVSSLWSHITTAAARVQPWLASFWLLGSVAVFAWSLVRVCRFSRVLTAECEVAPQVLQTAAERMARRLGLKTIPAIRTTSTHLSPMVWWTGGRVQVVIPAALLDRMETQQWQWILAHELAHVRRRDHLVRWLEWLACVCFWWNPVVWWAQRNLRAMEEICCDDLVISCLNPKPKSYANSLLSAVEFLARPALRPPTMASEINSGGALERRFKMIVSQDTRRSSTHRLRVCVLLGALVVLPLGVVSAQDYEAVGRRLRAAVAAGELTGEQARIMVEALRRADDGAREPEARARAHLIEVRKDLSAAVDAGRISQEDAARRYEAAEREIRERMATGRRGRDVHAEYEGFERRTRAAVAEGRMTRAEADAKRREFREQTGRKDVDWEGIKRRIEGAVEKGEITRAEADAKYREFRERVARKDVDWEGIKRRIEGAVERGDLTRAEADAKYRDFARQRAQEDLDWESIKRRIEGAVERGEITREQAEAKYREFRERMGRER